jgi:fatty-acyl-CoA synthase
MLGLMQDWPLLCHRIIEHAARVHGKQEVVTRSVEGSIHRTNYRDIHERALKVSQALDCEGIRFGDRIATIAWNTWRHLECWYGIMGIGAICHTVNPRLFPEQIAWIVNHAQDRIVITDITFVAVLEKISAKMPSVERYVVLTDKPHMPQTQLKNAIAYEEWIAECDGDFKWKTFDENTAAAMCYTSGTTGDPKGVLYSHRSNVIHSLIANSRDALGTSAADTMLPVVPLFHANSWGIAFSAPAMGTKLVMPGPKLDGPSVYELLDDEKVTCTAGVPTVWLMLLNYMSQNNLKLPHLKFVVCGGSAMPRSMIKAFVDMGIEVRHAWGMTEMSPLGTVGALKPPFAKLTGERKARRAATPGLPALRRPNEDYRRRGQGAALGREDLRSVEGCGPRSVESLLPRRQQNPRRRRLLRHRRRRHRRRARLYAYHRPFQGRDQVRLRVDLFHRSGKPCGRPPCRCRSRRHRRAPSQMGRASAIDRTAQAGKGRYARGNFEIHGRQDRKMVDAR